MVEDVGPRTAGLGESSPRMIQNFIHKIFGSAQQREQKRLWPVVDEINEHFAALAALSDAELTGKTGEFRGRLEAGNAFPAARLTIFGDIGWAGPRGAFLEGRPLIGSGVGASFLDGLVRLDLARAMRTPTGWRFGLYFEKFHVLEGSLVAVGADKRAIINRLLAAPVSEFWTDFLGELEEEPEKPYDFSQVQDVRALEQFLRDVGASISEAKRLISLCRSDAPPRDAESHPPKAIQTFAVRDVQELLRAEFGGLRTEILTECSALLRRALGKIE